MVRWLVGLGVLISLGAGCADGFVMDPGGAGGGSGPGDVYLLDGGEPADEPEPSEYDLDYEEPDEAEASAMIVAGEAGEPPPADPSGSTSAATAEAPPECPFFPGFEPQKKVVFVDHYPEQDLDIEAELLDLFAAAVAGSEIRIALFTFTRQRMADALVAAHRRGVDVRVIVDERNQIEYPRGSGRYRYRAAVQTLRAVLGDRLTVCNASSPPDGGGCQGPGINHNKIFLFSELCDGSRNVVAQGSANLTNPQTRSHNNMIVIRDDAELFTAYRAYWDDLSGQRMRPEYYHAENGATGTKAYFFPRAGDTRVKDPESDTIHNILTEGVECAGGTEIRIAMGLWTQARGYLVEDLAELHRRGCDVRVVVDSHGSTRALQEHLRSALPDRRVLIARGVHSKYLLIAGRYNGSERFLVWTGSHNYTGPALRRNDETLLRIDDRAVYEAYRGNWQRIWDTLGPP